MTRNLALLVFAITTFSISLVVVLWALSEDIREQPGSFLRQYPPHPAIGAKKIHLSNDHYYFAGATSDKIYLANTLKPLEVLAINSDMSDTNLVRLALQLPSRLEYVRITVRIDSPYYYFMDGAIPYMYRGTIIDWKGEAYMKDSTYFIDALPISNSSFAICALSARTQEKALGKLIVNDRVVLNHDVLQRQFDGLFDVDGSLSYDKELNKLVYLYFYRNEFMVMDTNLNLEFRANTIDTFKTAQIQTEKIHSDKSIRLSAPPVITNKSLEVSGNWLFIHSLLPAKNEDMSQFHRASVVDVYDLSSNTYGFSFYVFDEDGEKMQNFIVSGGVLYALFESSIRQYNLTERYLPRTSKGSSKL